MNITLRCWTLLVAVGGSSLACELAREPREEGPDPRPTEPLMSRGGTQRLRAPTGSEPMTPSDSDPLTHLRFLAADELRGRASPSPELDRAGDYVRALLQRSGVPGGNPTSEEGYGQSFELFSLARHEEPPTSSLHDYGTTLFEHGFYLDDSAPASTRALIAERLRDLGRPAGDSSTASLRAPATLAGAVRNVVGRLDGTGGRRQEVILLMAHLDHIGVTARGVNNGADDNASGSAVLLSAVPELARLSAEGELNRSVVFLWTAGEEIGLVGARYFADHRLPGDSKDELVGVLNMDMVGRCDEDRISVIDTDPSGAPNYWRELLEGVNARLPRPFTRINRDIDMYRQRHDGAVFAREGEPVLLLFEGLSSPSGGGTLIPEYHAPGDDLELILRDNGGRKLERLRDLVVALAVAAANRAP